MPVSDEVLSLTAVTDSENSLTKRTSVYCFQTSNIQRITFESKNSNPTNKESLPLYEIPILPPNTTATLVNTVEAVAKKETVAAQPLQNIRKIPQILKRDSPINKATGIKPEIKTDIQPMDASSTNSPRSGVDVLQMLVKSNAAKEMDIVATSLDTYSTPITSMLPENSQEIVKNDKPKKMKKDQPKAKSGVDSATEYSEKQKEVPKVSSNTEFDISKALKDMELRISQKIEASAIKTTASDMNEVLALSVRENISSIFPLEYKSVISSTLSDLMEKEMKKVLPFSVTLRSARRFLLIFTRKYLKKALFLHLRLK